MNEIKKYFDLNNMESEGEKAQFDLNKLNRFFFVLCVFFKHQHVRIEKVCIELTKLISSLPSEYLQRRLFIIRDFYSCIS